MTASAQRRLAAWAGVALLGLPQLAEAHERFVRHDLKHPLQDWFFRQRPGQPFGMDPNMLQVGLAATLVLSACFCAWLLRDTLDEVLRYRVLASLRGAVQRSVHRLACFVMDKPVRSRWFYAFGEWSVILFLRSPALVLMYSATNDSLLLPSYPLEPSSALYFKFAQVLLATLILTQTLLPLCGAVVIGTWLYLFRWGAFVAIDALPVLAAGVLYALCPWQSHKLAITRLNPEQARFVRALFGLSFVVLGWAKIYNHDLTIAVADNYPQVLADPLVSFFGTGTDPALRRETWVVSFALAEVISGFMVMAGVFTRAWGSVMVLIFAKLMLVDFGWDEIPHIYPIAAALAVVTSNHLRTELRPFQRAVSALRAGSAARRALLVAAGSLAIAFLVVMPMLYALTFTDRSLLRP